MKLKDAISMGAICGLYTVDECISNIECHCMSIFPYTEVNKQLQELYLDYKLWKRGDLILDIPEIQKEAERELDKYFDNLVYDTKLDNLDIPF